MKLALLLVFVQAMTSMDDDVGLDPLPISTVITEWDPQVIQYLQSKAFMDSDMPVKEKPTRKHPADLLHQQMSPQSVSLYSDEALARTQVYFGNPELFKLKETKISSSTQSLYTMTPTAMSVPPGLEIPMDDTEIWSFPHMTTFQVQAPETCTPELWMQTSEARLRLDERFLKYYPTVDGSPGFWDFKWGFNPKPDQPILQFLLSLPRGTDCQHNYILRSLKRTFPKGLQGEKLVMPVAKNRHWHPVLRLHYMPSSELSPWVPLLFRLYCYFHAIPEIGWYYPLIHILNRKGFDFEFDSAWTYEGRMIALYSSFARLMEYPSSKFTGDPIHGVQFYNFLVFLGHKLKVQNYHLLHPIRSHTRQESGVYYISHAELSQIVAVDARLVEMYAQEFRMTM